MHHRIELVGVQRLQIERIEFERWLVVVAHGESILRSGCDGTERDASVAFDEVLAKARLFLFAAIGGALTGLASYAFLKGLDWATNSRLRHGWIIWFLPVAGFAVGAAYHYLGGRAKGGTPAVIEQTHTYTHGVPTRMAPLIFGGSVVGHLFGASVGREGAALQLAGSVTDTAARAGRLSPDDRRLLVVASLAGGWGAVFAVPVTGIIFAMQVTKTHRWRALVPSVIAAFTGKWVVDRLGYRFGVRPQLPRTHWTIGLPLKLVLAGVVMGVAARVFVWSLKALKVRMAHRMRYQPLRTAVGGAITIALVPIFGRDYLGLSTPLMQQAFAGHHVDIWEPILKMLFTVIALGSGFVGGEVLPLFIMGAAFGSAIAPGLHAPGPLLATTGSCAAFASAASVAITGIVLAVEQFGWYALVPAIIVGLTARIVAGRPGLYVAH
jgi:H+/Cl- antiporter ClcA